MTISHFSSVNRSTTELGQDVQPGLAFEPVQADADLFSAVSAPDKSPATSRLSDKVASALSDTLGGSEKLSEQAIRALKKLPASGDGEAVLQMGRALSQCSLQTALTTKVVSKSVQALDKLTNLQ
ncbi:type III secretion system inner rod subunit SctI [Pseudomonas cannabina]|uniref:Type III secretion protein n=1 Tax=Pseudomonas cannabina TaxID=86840 RepID=A0A0N8QZD4_PSECA|nr:type III secretion system inner rod subunit SctI [Pseudomonas cannabina]KAA8712067.1 EscI/YscI/HrpB family type III secretion system inner rod protein [Pseudomonas cannabina]KPW78078.1 Type III secretion protein [Pseudomonas cannabina]RMN29911.1 Type III secretion protein [Pseudomonas cannabina]SDQ49822.1 type III secretion system major needle protein, YscF/MxiH/PrgI family [Pseudomonas cannabina]